MAKATFVNNPGLYFPQVVEATESPEVKEIVTNQPFLAPGDSIPRYSDADLVFFKTIIDGKISQAQKDLEITKNASLNENGTSNTDNSVKSYEEIQEYTSKETNGQLVLRLEKFIADLKRALIRIQNKTYGRCKMTQKLISKERLISVPCATMSVEGQELFDKMNKKK